MSTPAPGDAAAKDPSPTASAPPPADKPAATNGSAAPGGDTASFTNSTLRDFSQLRIRARGDANELKQVFIGSEGRASLIAFSMGMANPVPPEFEEKNAARHCMDEKVLASFVDVLAEKRLLLLTADADFGKGSTALTLAHALKKKLTASLAVWRVLPLDAEVRVDLQAVIRHKKGFRSGILLFKDALARGNRDLLALLATFDEPRLADLRDQLRASDSYLLFTADLETLDNLEPQLAMQGICVRVPGLEFAARREGALRALRAVDADLMLPESMIDEIATSIGSMPKIWRLLQTYLPQLHAGTMTVREASERLADVTARFHDELTEDFEAWTFAFVLTVALAVDPEYGISWTEFEELRRLLRPAVRACVRGKRPAREYTRESFSDNALLRKVLAVVERDPETGRDMLKFQGPDDARLLWRSLLQNNRSLLNRIFPILRDCMDHTRYATPGVRVRCAQIVGRMGEMDPITFTQSTLRYCAQQERMAVRASTAYIIEGACSGSDLQYRERCIRVLEEMASADSHTEPGLSDEVKKTRWQHDRALIWSAVAACKRLGAWDMKRTMEMLRDVAERNLAEPVAGARDLDRMVQEIESSLRDIESEDEKETAQLRVAADFVSDVARTLFSTQTSLLLAIQYTLVALCISVSPIEVLRHLRLWMTRSSGLSIVTALIYLQSGGIAESLEDCELPVDEQDPEGDTLADVNPIVSALVRDRSHAELAAAFLQDIFIAYSKELPSKVLPRLHALFMGHLKSMARQTKDSPAALAAVEELFYHLLISRVTELKTRLMDALRIDEDFRKTGTPLEKFARNLRRRALEPRAPG